MPYKKCLITKNTILVKNLYYYLSYILLVLVCRPWIYGLKGFYIIKHWNVSNRARLDRIIRISIPRKKIFIRPHHQCLLQRLFRNLKNKLCQQIIIIRRKNLIDRRKIRQIIHCRPTLITLKDLHIFKGKSLHVEIQLQNKPIIQTEHQRLLGLHIQRVPNQKPGLHGNLNLVSIQQTPFGHIPKKKMRRPAEKNHIIFIQVQSSRDDLIERMHNFPGPDDLALHIPWTWVQKSVHQLVPIVHRQQINRR
mgnify:CR=1 FL=1